MNDVIQILTCEKTCVLRQDTPDCNRDSLGCQCCDLIQEAADVVNAYDKAIRALRIYDYLRSSGITVCTQDKELLNVIEWAERIVK